MESTDKTSVDVREANPPVPVKGDDSKPPVENGASPLEGETKIDARPESTKKPVREKCSKKHTKRKSGKKSKKASSSSDSSSDSDSDSSASDSSSSLSSSSSDDDSESEAEKSKKKRVVKKQPQPEEVKKKTRTKKPNKASKGDDSSSSSSESDSDSSDSENEDKSENKDDTDLRSAVVSLTKQLQLVTAQLQQQQPGQQQQQQQQQQQGNGSLVPPPSLNSLGNLGSLNSLGNLNNFAAQSIYEAGLRRSAHRSRRPGLSTGGRGNSNPGGIDPGLLGGDPRKDRKKPQRATKLDFKRVDQVWDDSIHNYKLQDTAERTVDAQYDEFLFHVRRTFDWEGKYKTTIVDIKSKLLRECLQEVIGDVKGISLVDDTPKLDPNMLFLYLEDLRAHLKELKKKAKDVKGSKRERKKEKKRIKSKRQHLKVLIRYIDTDYAETKNSLYPMLENGLITFDLLWALWKPSTLAYTTTYGSHDEPRVFKVEMAEKHQSFLRGSYYYIEGKYFEYDGKQFGYGSMSEEVGEFRGARKITSLPCYPLKYHKDEAQLRKQLIERGKKFVALGGVHYKSHQGMAYYKKKRAVIKVNINGRVMVDPSTHRRINPNYPISLVRPKDQDEISGNDESDSSDDECGCGNDSDENSGRNEAEETIKFITKIIKNAKGETQVVRVPKDEADEQLEEESRQKKTLDKVEAKGGENTDDGSTATPASEEGEGKAKQVPEFTDEEYLIASPVVLGFAFAEKLWLEFTVSGIKDIQWNETAYESLVLEPKTKDIVRALVESHKYHPAESIDDVIQGKGKGLVAVLHGPPGTGKTLTAEGISELLKCPLYMASAGELGTDSRFLESELQKILDICHAWGAILLLDEADVFLEKRNMHDLHRNALVSIFLRQLEYFQGILFLTTNRVETFDDAFQSRIHIALRYDNLDHRARKAIFKIFIERVRVLEKVSLMPFTEEDYTALARHDLNGRQIKNTVRTAQALAVNKGEPLAMSHIRQVLEVQTNFERDLKGGTGYQDAMRSYF